jgi:YVTN family beta-propeller protein
VKLRHGLLASVVALSVLATVTQAQYVEDSIDVGHAWVGSLAYNSREDVLYGRCQQASIFFAIFCDSSKVINSYDLSYPRQMAYDSIDNKVYCAYEGAEEESLAVIDGRTHALIKSIRMPGATTPVWDPASDRVYVSCQSTNKVAVVDCATDSLLEYITVGACPLGMYINTLRRKLYVFNYDNGTVSIVNMATNQVIKTVTAGGTPNAGYYLPSVDKFYSAGAYGYCTVIDGAGDSIVAHVSALESDTGLDIARFIVQLGLELVEHRLGHVDTGYLEPGPGEREQNPSGTAGEFADRSAGLLGHIQVERQVLLFGRVEQVVVDGVSVVFRHGSPHQQYPIGPTGPICSIGSYEVHAGGQAAEVVRAYAELHHAAAGAIE